MYRKKINDQVKQRNLIHLIYLIYLLEMFQKEDGRKAHTYCMFCAKYSATF